MSPPGGKPHSRASVLSPKHFASSTPAAIQTFLVSISPKLSFHPRRAFHWRQHSPKKLQHANSPAHSSPLMPPSRKRPGPGCPISREPRRPFPCSNATLASVPIRLPAERLPTPHQSRLPLPTVSSLQRFAAVLASPQFAHAHSQQEIRSARKSLPP